MRPTFQSFILAKRGINAARSNLQVTGQNMTNALTPGYTRQRVDLYSVASSARFGKYVSSDVLMGEGVEVGGLSQLRDPFLDLRYRRECSKVSNTGTQLDCLTDLENILDEITKDGLDTQFSDLVKQLSNLSSNPSDPVAENIFKTSSLMLVKLFNHTADQINVVKDQQLEYLQDNSIEEVNKLLSNIAHINDEIKKSSITEDVPLELLDQRNMMLDELSGYVNFELETKKVSIGGGRYSEELSVNLIGSGGNKFNLINHNTYNTLGLLKDASGNPQEPITIQILNQDKTAVVQADINDDLTTGAFQGYLKMLNGKGEFDTPPTKDRGIGYYQNMVDTVARTFADMFNKTNSQNTTPPYDKPLFETINGSTDPKDITASNIRISSKWDNTLGPYVTASKVPSTPGEDNSKANDNLLYLISQLNSDHEFTTPSGLPLFKGSFQKSFTNISTTLGLEKNDVKKQHDTYLSVFNDITDQRNSISSVNIDEEGINLIMFNQSLTAASRYMTTIDEALDTIISRMGVVGR